jgi:heterotetrameric sarcosine oxidase delta subunit
VQLFPCPWCGLRTDHEFRYGGDAGKQRPGRAASDAEWARYRFFRANTRGAAHELWLHADGCGRWVEIDRDTVSHQTFATRPMTP